MPKSNVIELPDCEPIAILYEDRSVLAIDKPAGWLLAPSSWQKTSRNLQSALEASILARDFWARSRNLKYVRFLHRLDADTSGVLLMARNPGVIRVYGALFESRRMEKKYLAVVHGRPQKTHWTCSLKIGADPAQKGRMKIDSRAGRQAESEFHVLEQKENTALILARPLTGRTHQIRVHLLASGHPVVGDRIYGGQEAGSPADASEPELALRSVYLGYTDPFTRKHIEIRAPFASFIAEHGFEVPKEQAAPIV